MENKEPLFDFLENVVGQLEVKPTEQARDLHLKAMNQQLMLQAQQRSQRRILKGLGGAILIVLLLAGLNWLLFSHSDKPNLQLKHHSAAINSQNPTNSANTNSEINSLSKTSSTNTTLQNKPVSTKQQDTEASTNINTPTIPTAVTNPAQSQTLKSSIITASTPSFNPYRISAQIDPSTISNPNTKQSTPLTTTRAETAAITNTNQNKGKLPWHGLSLPLRKAYLDITYATIKQKKNAQLKLAPLKFRPSDTIVETIKPNIKARNTFSDFAIGVHYTPEFMFNTLDQSNKLVNNAGLEVTWVKGPYSIRTGIGISIATGVTALGYDYNDYLGTTKKLDSVAFAYDTQGRKIIPSWYYSDKVVYDTALLSLTNEISKRYTYLQFPLILGYDFHQGKKLAFGFRAGPVLQVLIKEDELKNDPGAGDNLVVSINQLTPDRMATHWQALLGINSSLMLSKRIRLELEPHLKYYFNSVYEKTATTSKPWSVELRTALIIKL